MTHVTFRGRFLARERARPPRRDVAEDVGRHRAWLVAPLAWVALAIGPATAECAGASIEIFPARAAPGSAIRVEGTAFAFCDDTTGPCGMFEATPPYETATVSLVDDRGIEGVELGTAAIQDGAFTIETTLPNLPPGRYWVDVRVDGGGFDAHADPFRVIEG